VPGAANPTAWKTSDRRTLLAANASRRVTRILVALAEFGRAIWNQIGGNRPPSMVFGAASGHDRSSIGPIPTDGPAKPTVWEEDALVREDVVAIAAQRLATRDEVRIARDVDTVAA